MCDLYQEMACTSRYIRNPYTEVIKNASYLSQTRNYTLDPWDSSRLYTNANLGNRPLLLNNQQITHVFHLSIRTNILRYTTRAVN